MISFIKDIISRFISWIKGWLKAFVSSDFFKNIYAYIRKGVKFFAKFANWAKTKIRIFFRDTNGKIHERVVDASEVPEEIRKKAGRIFKHNTTHQIAELIH